MGDFTDICQEIGIRKRSSSAVLAELGKMVEDLYLPRYAKKK